MQGVLLDFIKGMAGGFAFIYLYFLFAGGFKEYFSFSFGSLSSTQRAVGGIPFPALPLGELAKGAFAFLGAKELLFYIPFLLYAGSWVYLIHCFIVSWLHGLPPLNPSGVTLRIFDLPPHITLLPKFKLFFTKESLTKKLKERLYTGNNLIVSPDGEKPSENFLGEWEKRDLIIPLFLTVYGSLSMMTVFVRSDLEHLSFASIPFLLLFFYYVERLLFSFPRLLREEKNRRRLFLKTTAAVFFITFGSAYLLLSKPDYEKGLLAVFYPRELFFSGEAQGLSLAPSLGVNLLNEQSWAVEDVKAEILGSQERIYQHGFFEGAYFLGNRRNFTYFDFDDWAGESEQKEIISKLEDNKVKRVFANEGFRITNHSLIDEYLRTYFKREKLIGEIALYVRNEVPFEDNFGEKGLRENLAVVWRETKKGTFELSLMGTEATKIRLAVRIAYLPLTGFLAKTKATLFVTSEESGEEKFLTETAFLLPYNQEGQVVFRLGEGRKLDKLRLVFEAPGAFNPFPTEIEIEKTWIYK